LFIRVIPLFYYIGKYGFCRIVNNFCRKKIIL